MSRRILKKFVRCRKQERRGAVAVETALVLPVFVTLVLGISQASRWLETQNILSSVAREGARMAAMDRGNVLDSGDSTNEKIEADIKNFLKASGIAGDDASVYIVDPADHTTPMDLDAPENQLELFELRVELPFSSVTGAGTGTGSNLVSKIVFRNAPASYAQ
jgi:Flp pilus assembly protein TadG